MIKSIEKMTTILALFSIDRPTLFIKEIQEELNIPKSTAFRILDTLEKLNFIQRNEATHEYSLGYQFFRLGSIYQMNLDYRTVALPYMKELMEETKETVELNILDGIHRVCIEKIYSPLDIRNFVRIGERKPAYLGASGKVMLAFLPAEELSPLLMEIEELNVIDMKEFKEELQEIKDSGYAITHGERILGTYSIAAPILGVNGQLVAGINLAGPLQRLTEERTALLKARCIQTAKKISLYMGYAE